MVEDSQIKAEVSPFAIREGEIKVFDGKDGYVSMNQIINKINLGHITDIHFQILEIVNEFEFITSRQIYQLLQIKGIEIKSQDKLNKKLEQFEKAYPEAFKANVKTPPMGHFGNNELEIGRVCVQLANPDFKYMTGETLTLEGGLGLRP